MWEVLGPVLGIGGIVTIIAGSVIAVRFASVFAKRLEARSLEDHSSDPAIGELRAELEAVHERLDFIERALVAQRNQGARALPGPEEQP